MMILPPVAFLILVSFGSRRRRCRQGWIGGGGAFRVCCCCCCWPEALFPFRLLILPLSRSFSSSFGETLPRGNSARKQGRNLLLTLRSPAQSNTQSWVSLLGPRAFRGPSASPCRSTDEDVVVVVTMPPVLLAVEVLSRFEAHKMRRFGKMSLLWNEEILKENYSFSQNWY